MLYKTSRCRSEARLGGRHWWLIVLAVAAVAAACSGERPTFIEGSATTTTTTIPTTTIDPANVPVPARDECQSVSGPGPLQVVVESADSSNPCIAVAAHHRLEFVNNTDELIEILVGDAAVPVEVGASAISSAVGSLLPTGYTPIIGANRAIIGVWVAAAEENTLVDDLMGLSSFGPLQIGQTPLEVSAALGGLAVATSAEPCYVTDLDSDPYSPLFTVRDGTVAAIRVFTPGQLTRSAVGVGTAEAEVVAAYGDRIETMPSPDGDPNRSLLVFVPADEADQAFRLVFEVEGGMVVSMRNGLTDIVIDDPTCGG